MNLEKRTPIVYFSDLPVRKYTIGERFIIVLKTKQMFLIIFYAKFKMALWRVLGIDKCGALTRAAAKHTPRKRQQEQHGKPNRKRGGAEPSPLTRLGTGCRFFAA